MRIICIGIILTITLVAAFAQGFTRIEVARSLTLNPPEGTVRTEGLPVRDDLPREAVVFEFPEDFFAQTTAILHSTMTVEITVAGESEEIESFPIFCIPLARAATSLDAFAETFTEITEDDLAIAEVGFYDPESGEAYFEMSGFLRQIRDNDIRFYGICLVPGENAPTFTIAAVSEPIELKCDFGIGKRDVPR